MLANPFAELDESSYLLSLECVQDQKELMLEKSLLMFSCASERRPLDSHVREGSQTILKCYESSIQGKLCCCAEAEMSF